MLGVSICVFVLPSFTHSDVVWPWPLANCSKWPKSWPYIWPTGPNVLLTKRHKFVRFDDSPTKVKVTKVRLHRF